MTRAHIEQRAIHPKKHKPRSLSEALKGKLTPAEQQALQTSYDSLGNLLIIEIPPELVKKEKLIGTALLEVHPNVTTVCKKIGIHTGTYRTQTLRIIAGKRSKEAEYVESGVRIRLHAEKVYFSPRLSSERLRIAAQVRPGERVLVMFSGCGPYSLVIGRAVPTAQIIGVEINPVGHRYANENVALNKLKNITNYCGDVRKVVPKLGGNFDRIIMVLPKNAHEFLDLALAAARPGAMIHLYSFAIEEGFEAEGQRIGDLCTSLGYRTRVVHVQKCGAYKPKVYRVCVDLAVEAKPR